MDVDGVDAGPRDGSAVDRSTGRTRRQVDVLIVGAGPAGLSAAAALSRAGAGRVEVLDREAEPGGIPRHCHHTGYGLADQRRLLTGPAYARRLVGAATDAGARVRAAVTVTGWSPIVPAAHAAGRDREAIAGWAHPGLAVDVTGPDGLERIAAGAIVLATGARERPRSARQVPGDRPAGVYTTGELQQAVHLFRQRIGRRAVVVGAELVSYSSLLTLRRAGVEVAAMVSDLPRSQVPPTLEVAALLGAGVRPLSGVRLTRIVGRRRVEAVELIRDDGRAARVACDTVVLTGDWIPDHELARRGGLALDGGTRGPSVDACWRTSMPGVFAVGNLVHPVATATVCALGARLVSRAVLDHRAGTPAPGVVRVTVAPPLRWVSPQRIAPVDRPPERLLVWADADPAGHVLRVVQDGRELHARRLGRIATARQAVSVDAVWTRAVDPDPDAGPIQVRLDHA